MYIFPQTALNMEKVLVLENNFRKEGYNVSVYL